jgi:riboflavin synthase
MFTGIVEEVGVIQNISDGSESIEVLIQCSFAGALRVDQSISVNGVCLTVTRQDDDCFAVQCVKETLQKTTLESLEEGRSVNLERSLTLEDGIDGHLVQGHVDRVACITDITEKEDDRIYEIEVPSQDSDLIVPRGSICIDGISLTIARKTDSSRFKVAVIPYTYGHTNLGSKKPGDLVNIEYDVIGKYVVNYMNNRQRDANHNRDMDAPAPETITKKWLKDRGY